jgi:hypothetical protein
MATFRDVFPSDEQVIAETLDLYRTLEAPSDEERKFFDLVVDVSRNPIPWGYTITYPRLEKLHGGLQDGTPGEKARYTLLTFIRSCRPASQAAEKDPEPEIKKDLKTLRKFVTYAEAQAQQQIDEWGLVHTSALRQLRRTEYALSKLKSKGTAKKRNRIWFRRILGHVNWILEAHDPRRLRFFVAGAMMYGGVEIKPPLFKPAQDPIALYRVDSDELIKHDAPVKDIERRLREELKTLGKEVKKHGAEAYYDIWDL